MQDRQINPTLKMILELGPSLAFFVAYLFVRDETFVIGGEAYEGFIVITAAFVPVLLASIGVLWALTGKISRMQVFTALLVIVFGGLTFWFNDERFFKMKTTLVYAFFAVVLSIGLLLRQSWLQFVLGDALPMDDAGWMILTKRLTATFYAMALANEVVWRTQSTDFWVTFETFVMPAVLIGVFMSQARLIERHSLPRD